MKLTRLIGCVALALSSASWAAADAPRAVVINPNGGWSWFGDERAVVDSERGVLYVGSLANGSGHGGKAKDGDVEVTRVDLATGDAVVDVLHRGLTSYGGGDDHNVASLLVLPGGRVLAAYTGHNNAPVTYFRTYDPGDRAWGPERVFDWDQGVPGGSSFACTYNNLFYLPGSGTVLNISRNHQRCPNVIASTDGGESWAYRGQLLRPTAVEGATGFYVNGYLKYSQRGDRIDLLATERHPRNYDTGLYHGYLLNGALHNTAGAEVDARLDARADAQAVDLTTVYASKAANHDPPLNHAWMADVERYPDGAVAAVYKVRVGGSVENHRFYYAVLRDGRWSTHPLAEAGGRLFPREEDYTGLAALDPTDPGSLYVSTPVHPGTGVRTRFHELYHGRSHDDGATWSWRAVTADSPASNLRPILPRWESGRTALVWMRGEMASSQDYDMAVMLMVDPPTAE